MNSSVEKGNYKLQKVKSTFVIFWLFFLSLFSFSQTPQIYHYSSAEGLPSTECYSVAQDSKGNIWIATDRGVSRFNGYEFVNYTTEDGLTDNTVFTIKEDYKGRIWFHGYNGMLCYFIENKIHPYKYNETLSKAFTGGRIARSFYVDKKDNISISYIDHGIITISNEGKMEFPDIFLDKHPSTVFFAIMRKGQVYFGSSRSWDQKKKYSSILTNIFQDSLIITDFFPKQYLNNINGIKLKNGNYLFSTLKAAMEVGPTKEPSVVELKEEILSFLEDSKECLWTGLFNQGVRKYEKGSKIDESHFESFLPGLSVTGILEDNEGGYWFSTLQDGIYYMPCPDIRSINFSESSKPEAVSAICGGSDGFVFVGTSNGSVYKLSDRGELVENFVISDFKGPVKCLFYSSGTSELFIGTGRGLSLMNKNGVLKELNSSQVRAISLLNTGELIFTSHRGILKINKYNQTDTLALLPITFRVDVLHVDKGGKVWLGCVDGLYSLENKLPVKDTSAFLRTRVIDIKSMQDQSMVIATIGKGIVIKFGSKYKRLDESNGLSSNIVNSIHVEGNTIIAATNKGLCEIKLEGANFIIRNFTKEHGLPTNELKAVYMQDNRIWLGTNNSLVSFQKDIIPKNTRAPGLAIENVFVNGEEIDSGSVQFMHDENFFEFRYTGYCFRKRGEINYRYRLVGLNDDWQETRNRNIQYTSLDPGSYRFELKAQNEEGAWTEIPLVYKFEILLPYWKEPLFLIAVSLLTFSLAFGFVRWRFSQIRIKNELVLQMNEFQRKALAAQMNPHFIFNSLNSINSFIINEDRTRASKYLNSFAKLMRLCLNNSDKKYVPIKDEYDLLKVYLELEELRFKKKFRSEINIDSSILNSSIQVPSMLLQPYIENAILHGLIPREEGDQGKIEINIGLKEKDLCCTIQDNGIGRVRALEKAKESSHKYESKGTIITEERMKVYIENTDFNYFFEIEDLYDDVENPTGTIVRFHLPYIQEL